MDLSIRSTLPETLDHEGVDLAVYQRCLEELAVINHLTFTHRATLRWLEHTTKTLPPGAALSVLDVGYGHGDLLRAIARWAERRRLNARLSGIDLNPRSAVVARRATPENMAIDYRTDDVFEYTPSASVDFIVSSQFAHHLNDDQVVAFLAWIEMHSRRGWHIADLHRHTLPYRAFPMLAGLMGWHHIVRDDGVTSIARSFRHQDWQTYLDRAGVQAKVSWHMAFRLCVSRMKSIDY